MPEELATSEREELRREVNCLRSGVLLWAWTVAALNEGANGPKSESQRFELAEGQSFVLELLAARLFEVYGKLNEE